MKHPDAEIEALLSSLAPQKLPTIDLSLDRIYALLAKLGDPQKRVPPVIHVAGTNGKGSVLAYLKAILEAANYKVHRYTSPHLVKFNERITIADKEISDYYLGRLLTRILQINEEIPATAFESITAMAFQAFAEMQADVLLLETGLGGRLDATNVIAAPVVTAIMPISMDHMDYLGNTLEKIAAEKAGILKAKVPCIVGPQKPEAMAVIEEVAAKIGAPLFKYGEDYSATEEEGRLFYRSKYKQGAHYPLPSLIGEHQLANAAAAIACIEHLRDFTVSNEQIGMGFRQAVWPARLQHLTKGKLAELVPASSELWLDGGHNAGAGVEIAAWMKKQQKKIHVVCGMLSTKDTEAFLKPMVPYVASVTGVAIPGDALSQSADTISATANKLGIVSSLSADVKSAIEVIVNDHQNVIILVCGSLSLAGNTLWQNGTEP